MDNREYFEKYVSNLTDIRKLSSPEVDRNDSSDLYRERLKENFKKIGQLAYTNHHILDDVIFPLLRSETDFSDPLVEEVRKFNDSLVNGATVENLDVAIMSLLTDRLNEYACEKGGEDYIIEQLDNQILCCNIFLFITSRISVKPEMARHFRDRGLEAARKLLEYLEYDRFKTISDDSKTRVLTNARFHSTFYGSVAGITPDEAHAWVSALEDAYRVYKDPFYRNAHPTFDWDLYLFRILEHYSVVIDFIYDEEIYSEDLDIINERVRMQEVLWNSDPEKFGEYGTHEFVLTSLYFSQFLKGELDKEEYREKLLALYKNRNSREYDYDNLYVNLRTVINYMLTVKEDKDDEKVRFRLEQFYQDACAYVFRMPNSGTMSEFLDYLSPMIERFIEVPGGMTFAEMCLKLLAAFHAPSYVHSVMVAKISRCLCHHLIDREPELFVGVRGNDSLEDVRKNRERLALFAYRSGLYHDFGKLVMIDTIFIYGRRLLDFEFDIIRQHPAMGASMMRRYGSTADYADVALLHHKWYDDSAGYPGEYKKNDSPTRVFVDITAVDDCMDAATDSIGRGYGGGKSLDQFIDEVRAGAGTRYSPVIAKMIEEDQVKKDLEYLLSEGRNSTYRDTFLLLRGVQEREDR